MKQTKDGKVCCIPTFSPALPSVNVMAEKIAVSSAVVQSKQEEVTNPELANCGGLPSCRDCTIINDPEVQLEMQVEALKGVVARTTIRIKADQALFS